MIWISTRLGQWSDWARGSHYIKVQTNPLADMMRIAAGEVPGRDLSVPYDMTVEIEQTDKAVAKLRDQNPQYKRIIMKYWMGHDPMYVIADDMKTDESRVKELLMRAQLQVGRNIIMIEQGLTDDLFGRKI
jgi:hypothetical protein